MAELASLDQNQTSSSNPGDEPAGPPPPNLTRFIIRIDGQYQAGGGFGDVYKCRYTSGLMDQEIAVKALRFKSSILDGDTQDKSLKMLRRELGIWKRLSHNNIVPFLGIAYGFGMSGAMSLVSLWMPNGTLHKFLAVHDNKLATPHRLQILHDVCKGLYYLHSFSSPVVHGDLNPNNVLLDAEYTARLTDFGYASLAGYTPEALAYLQRSTVRPGALRWIAPEQINEATYDRTTKSDIYSLGCIALQILSGKQPWAEVREDMAIVIRLHQGHIPGRPKSRTVDDLQWDIIQRCWLPLQDRPTMGIILHSVQQLLDNCRPFKHLRDLFDPSSSQTLGELVDGLSTPLKNPPLAESVRPNEIPPDDAAADKSDHTDNGHGPNFPFGYIRPRISPLISNVDKQGPSSSTREKQVKNDVAHGRPLTPQPPPANPKPKHSHAQERKQSYSIPGEGKLISQQPVENRPEISFQPQIYTDPQIIGRAANWFKPYPDDSIIMIMGPSGSGKTNFINSLTGNTKAKAANLGSATQSITSYSISHRGNHLVLVDTPGFDDTRRSDMETLRLTANWLVKKYPGGETLKLTGVIYLHRITDSRMSGTVFRNLNMFGRICGNIPLRRARMVTTMWDKVKGGQGFALAENRERELISEFWQPLINGGALSRRFDNGPGAALRIVDELIGMEIAKDELLLQEELVEQHKRLNETEAGKALYSRFQQLLTEQKRTLKELADEAKLQNDPSLASSLQKEYDKVNAQLQQTLEEIKSMEISLPRRVALQLSGWKSRGKAVMID